MLYQNEALNEIVTIDLFKCPDPININRFLFILNNTKDDTLSITIFSECIKFEIPTNKPHKNEIDDAIELITKLKELNK